MNNNKIASIQSAKNKFKFALNSYNNSLSETIDVIKTYGETNQLAYMKQSLINLSKNVKEILKLMDLFLEQATLGVDCEDLYNNLIVKITIYNSETIKCNEHLSKDGLTEITEY